MECPCDPDPMAEASGDVVGVVPAGVAGAACRINSLTSDVLIRAISFLDARQLVQTCVLSRRWRNLWRSAPRISTRGKEFDLLRAGTLPDRALLSKMFSDFKRFLNRFLMLRNPTPLDEFDLWYYIWDSVEPSVDLHAESEDANLWIGHALQCKAWSVKVSVEDARLYLDPAVFASKCFLTSLEFSRVVLSTGFFKNLRMGCTLLERLELYDCAIADAEISSQTLKLFTIDTDCFFTSHEQASISIPSLIDLGYFSFETIPPLLTNLGSLETATVSIPRNCQDTPVGDVCQFLRGLSNVTHLDFCYQGQTLKMEKNFHWCPKFNNLTILTLGGWCLCADFYALIVFLQNSPNLMKLTLQIMESPGTNEKFIGELEERYFNCEHLEIVKIICPMNWKDDPVLNNLKEFLVGNGISPDQIKI